MGYAAWPELDELKQMLDVDPTTNVWDGDQHDDIVGPTRLTRLLLRAIEFVKQERGNWNEYDDEPDEGLSQAALRIACLLAQQPNNATPASVSGDTRYQALMKGKRRVWGIS